MLHVFTGPPGSGKTTLIDGAEEMLKCLYPGKFGRVRTSTTRRIRKDELGKPDPYDRFSRLEFIFRILRREFVEWAIYSGNLYGLRWKRLKEAQQHGRSALVTLDFQGAVSILKSTDPEIVRNRHVIYVHVSDPAALRARMIARNHGVVPHDIDERMRIADRELRESAKYPQVVRVLNDGDPRDAIWASVESIKRHRESLLVA